VLVGVDVGGTFTDFVTSDLRVHKVPSSPRRPADAVVLGVRHLDATAMALGTTVATNAVLEGKGARTALVTTAGFEDVIAIGRQDRPSLYDLRVVRPDPLVPAELRYGLPERVAADGGVVRPLPPAAVAEIAAKVRASGAESVAVCLLFSFLRPEHEVAVRDALGGLPVSLSSEVLPEFREYERTSTTVLDAYVKPLVHRYVADLEAELGGPFLVMRSSGGVLRSTAVRAKPLEMLLSGPAGGVAAAKIVADLAGEPNVVTFDMGGTSADVSVIEDGQASWTTEASLAGHPIAAPVVDITSVGAGGGSVVWFDAGGALRVGPRSAGAEPGPACYGRGGTDHTVADADLLGGALPPSLLGGTMALDVRAAERAMMDLLPRLGSVDESIVAVQSVVRATMASAIRLALSRRGLDPRGCALLAFGGAGGLHAAYLARDLGIRRVLVPFLPGAFSAYGVLVSDVRLDYGRTRVTPLAKASPVIEGSLAEFEARARRSFADQGFAEEPLFAPSVDLRYVGQSYEVNVPVEGDLEAAFHRRHAGRYGYAAPNEPVEIVTVRLIATIPRPVVVPLRPARGEPVKGTRRLACPDGREEAVVYDRAALPPGFEAPGPAIVEEDHATTLVPPGARFLVDRRGLLAVEVGA
jgi:N-methylhydantoinase A